MARMEINDRRVEVYAEHGCVRLVTTRDIEGGPTKPTIVTVDMNAAEAKALATLLTEYARSTKAR